MKKKNSRQENVQRYMLKTYFVIACISVFIGIFLCIFMLVRTSRTARENMDAQMEKIRLTMDQVWKDVEDVCGRLCQDGLVKQVLGYSSEPFYHGNDVLDVQTLMETFNENIDSCKEVLELYMLNRTMRTMICSRNIYHQTECGAALASMELNGELLETIGNGRKSFLHVIQTGTKQVSAFWVCGIFKSSYEWPDGYLIAKINVDWLMETMELLGNGDNERCFLAEQEWGYIGTDSKIKEIFQQKIMAAPDVREGYFFCGQGIYVYGRCPSDYWGLEYCYVVPAFIYYEDIYMVIAFTAVNAIVWLTVSTFLAYRFSKKNTEPLQELSNVLEGSLKYNGRELSYNRILENVSELTSRVQKYERTQEQIILLQILFGQEKDLKKIKAYEQGFADKIREGFFVLEIKVQDINELSDANVLMFCVINVFGELLADCKILEPVESWDRACFLIAGNVQKLKEILAQGVDYMDEKLSIAAACGISERLYSFSDIYNGKNHADYMIEYVELIPELRSQMWYEDVAGDFKEGGVPTSDFQNDSLNFRSDLNQFIHRILLSDFAGSRELLAQIWKKRIYRADIGPDCARSRMMTLTSIVSIPYKERFGIRSFGGPKKHLLQMYTFTDDLLTRLDKESEPEHGGKKTFEQMRAYIREHAQDPSMTAGSVSEVFHLTASYASGMFKKYTGEGILDAIHKERISQAKQLLKSGLSVQEAAVRTGYLDARGFIRTFKKYEGITPGQYKSIHWEEGRL